MAEKSPEASTNEKLPAPDCEWKATLGQPDRWGQNKLAPSDDRWKLRSTTYQGIAEAMADQWT